MDESWFKTDSSWCIPPDAVIGGHTANGAVIFVGRALHQNFYLPAAVIASKKTALIGWAGVEISTTNFEILTGTNYKWLPGEKGSVPENSVIGGQIDTGEAVFIGRGLWKDSLIVGKVHPTHRCLYIPFKGKDISLENYEVLTYTAAQGERRRTQNASMNADGYLEEEFASGFNNLSTSEKTGAKQGNDDKKATCGKAEPASGWTKLEASSSVPPGAIIGGHLSDGSIVYVGRAPHDDNFLPASVVPRKKSAYIGWAGQEIVTFDYEVLTGKHYKWVPGSNGSVPSNAVMGGQIHTGEAVFIGRGYMEGSLIVGKVHPTNRCLYVPFKGLDPGLHSYEVLAYSPPDKGTQEPCNQHGTWVSGFCESVPENAVQVDNSPGRYVGRSFHKGDLLPAMIVPDKKCAYVCHGGKTVEKHDFEVLVGGEYHWQSAENGFVPEFAVNGGYTAEDEPLFIGRTVHLGQITMGKVQQSRGCVLVAAGELVVPVKNYEVLVFAK